MGDFRAQIASIRTGERRLAQLLERYGAETFKESVKLIFDQPMERASVESAFSIDPKIDGAFAWSDDNTGSTLIFTTFDDVQLSS